MDVEKLEEEAVDEEARPGWLHSGFPWWTLTRKRKRGHFLEGLLKVTGQSGLCLGVPLRVEDKYFSFSM